MDASDSRETERSTTQCSRIASVRGRRLALGSALLCLALVLLTSPDVEALMAGNGFMWSVWSSAPVQLVVCWENPTAADPLPGEADTTPGWQRREWARLALKRTWEREARVVFVGWQTCQNEGNPASPPQTYGPRRPGTADENIKIWITTSGKSQNPGHGSWGDYMQSGVRLNLHCGSRACIEFLATHEFGHVLGLYHEEERVDWPTNIAGCPRQTYADTPPWWPVPTEKRWGAPDRNSVMAYCAGEPPALSLHDVAGIQRAYDRHLPGTLLSLPGSLCLSGHANGGNGTDAFGWACDEAYDNQEWRYNPASKALFVRWPADLTQTPRCLDVDTANGTDVQLWDCLQGPNQQWQFQQTMVRGYGGLCLTRPPTGTGSLSMQTCTGASTQLWRIVESKVSGYVRLRAESSNLCLAFLGAAGSNALVAPCSQYAAYLPLVIKGSRLPYFPLVDLAATEAAAQGPAAEGSAAAEAALSANPVRDFRLRPGGMIDVPSLNLCMDVQDVLDSDYRSGLGGPAVGQRVQFFNCLSNQLNQRWGISGHVVSESKCLGLAGAATTNGALASVGPCTTAPQQNWDYYW